jgi:hypothetical protein
MKKIIFCFISFIFVSSIAMAETKNFEFGLRYPIGSYEQVSLNVATFEIQTPIELFLEWRPLKNMQWLGVEVSGQLGNSALNLNGSTASEMILPAVTVKYHAPKLLGCDLYIGAGLQYMSASGEYLITGTLSDGTIQQTKNFLSGGGLSTVFQGGINIPILTKGLSIGVDAKYTPWCTSSVDLSTGQVSYNGGVWSQYTYGDAKLVITKLFQSSVSLSYQF